MKVGTLTFHMVQNYGATLQAYALPYAINELGYDCEIINFVPNGSENICAFEWPKDLVKKYGLIKGLLKSINRFRLGIYSKKSKMRNFAYFANHFFSLSKNCYSDLDELKSLSYDVIVFGSDQIWNCNITPYFDTVYLGNFTCDNKFEKVAYAASSGNEDFFGNEKIFERELKDFKAISVRENGLATIINEKFNLKSQLVLDPVFLLSATEWRKLKCRLPKGVKRNEYILVYTFDGKQVYDYALELGREKHLPVVVLRWDISDEMNDAIQLINSAPQDFITLIDEAAIVCTTSFHGTAFSIIFEKELYCLTSGWNGHRIDSLMGTLGKNRDSICVERNLYHCDNSFYGNSKEKLQSLKEISLKFLKESIE